MIKIKLDNADEAVLLDELEIKKLEAAMDIQEIQSGVFSVIYHNQSHEIIIQKIDRDAKKIALSIDGISTEAKITSKIDLLLEQMGISTTSSQKMSQLKAPMPGLIVDWYVQAGDHVQAGDKLLILEAMKMENIIKSTGEGIVKRICVVKGSAIEKNQVLIEFE